MQMLSVYLKIVFCCCLLIQILTKGSVELYHKMTTQFVHSAINDTHSCFIYTRCMWKAFKHY